MKLITSALIGALSAFSGTSAFAPSSFNGRASSGLALSDDAVTGFEGKAAASKEDDLALTLSTIMKHDEAKSSSAKEDEESHIIATVESDDDDAEIDTDTDNDIHTESECQSTFDDILQARRTINSFEPSLPKNWEKILRKAIQSAIYAPNHKRTEPWRFHLLGPEAIEKICKLNASLVAKKKGEKAGQKKLERWLQMPGWLVVTCETENSEGSMDSPMSLEREDYAACCCAVQNLCLSLHNEGMGTKWTTGPVNFDDQFGEILDLGENEYVVGTIWFGTPEKIPDSAPLKKKSMDDVFIQHK